MSYVNKACFRRPYEVFYIYKSFFFFKVHDQDPHVALLKADYHRALIVQVLIVSE